MCLAIGVRLIAIILCAVIASTARAEATGEILERMIKAAQQQQATLEGNNPEARLREAQLRVLLAIRTAVENGSSTQVEQLLNELAAQARDPELSTQVERLRWSLKADKNTAVTKLSSNTDTLIKQSAHILRNAADPSDLDELIQNVTNATYRAADVAGRGRLDKLLMVVRDWQDYLAATKNRQFDRARAKLESLSYSVPSLGLMPRSELLARMDTMNPGAQAAVVTANFKATLQKIKKASDLTPAITELEMLDRSGRTSSTDLQELHRTIGTLKSLAKVYEDFRAGLPASIGILAKEDFPNGELPEVAAVRRTLLLAVLPQLIKAPADVQPNAGEGVLPFIDRVVAEARARKDFSLMARTVEVRSAIANKGQTSTEQAQLNQLAAAQNQETAGEYMLAVVSYQNALKSPSAAVPAEIIGARLAGIKTAHPTDYARGLDLFLSGGPGNKSQ